MLPEAREEGILCGKSVCRAGNKRSLLAQISNDWELQILQRQNNYRFIHFIKRPEDVTPKHMMK